MHTTRKLVQAITVSLACALPTIGFAADNKHKGEIEVQSYSFGAATKGKTGGANQIKADDTKGAAAKPKPGGGPKPTESMSLNFEKVKSNTQGGPNQVTPPQQPPPQPAGMLVPAVQKGSVAPPPSADGTVDGRDYLLWRKNLSQQPAGGASPAGPTDLGAKKDPKEIPLLVPAVQKVREAAGPQKNAGGATAAQQTGASTPRSYDTKEKKK